MPCWLETSSAALQSRQGGATQICHPNVMWCFQNPLDSAVDGKKNRMAAEACQLSGLGRQTMAISNG
jgi:hypothetical protein